MKNKPGNKRRDGRREILLDEFLMEEDGVFDDEDEDTVTDDTLEFLCLDDETIASYRQAQKRSAPAGKRTSAGVSAGRAERRRASSAGSRRGNVYRDEDYYEADDASYGDEEYYEADDASYGDEEYYEADDASYGDEECYEADDASYGDEEYYEADDASYGDEEYYEADDASCGDEEYYEADDASYGDEEYYEADDASYGDEEYYEADDASYGDEEYYEADDEYYEDEDFEMEDYDDEDDDYDYEEEYDEYDDDFDGVIGKIRYFMAEMSALDMIVAMLGIVVLVGVIATGALYVNARTIEEQVAEFATVGEEIEGISVIGESGLIAVTESARLSGMVDLAPEEEAPQEDKPQEEKKDEKTTVVLNLTSIQSDLKIKFVNKETGKLIGGVPFEAEVSDGKKTFEVKDEDKDGIVYQTGIAAGTYNVTVKPFEAGKYEDYALPSSASSVKVTDKISYKKVDVADEVKTEAEVNAAAEDTKVQDTAVESKLTDTVEWVESTKTPLGEGKEDYEEVSKKDIPDPWTVSSNYRKLVEEGEEGESFDNVSISLNNSSLALEKGESASLKVSVSGTSLRYTVEWSSSDSAVASVSDGSVSAVGTGSATICARVAVGSMIQEVNCSVSVTDSEDDKNDNDKDDENKDDNAGGGNDGDDKKDEDKDGDDKKDEDKDGDDKKDEDKDDKDKDDKDKDKDKDKDDKDIVYTKVSISGETEVAVGKTITLTAKTEPKDGKVIWSSDNDRIAKVDDKGVVTGVEDGTVKIRVQCRDAEDITDSVKITVTKAAVDGSAKLKDKDGNQLYYRNSNGDFKEAVYDDYNKRETFYKKISKVSGYKYTGWQTIDGHVYFYDKNGNYVTGEQVIQGAKYSFGSDGKLASNSGTMGIDVSKWNGSIDWNAVKNSGVSYVIIRCGYRGSSTGVLVEDPKFRSNIKGAKAAGLKVGAYFFSQAVNEVEAVEEASMAINLVSGYGLNYPLFLDVEASGGRGDGISRETRTAVCRAFCATVQDSGYSAGIYANKTWFNEKINTGSLTNYKIWLAQYASAPTYSATRYDMWQYSSKGKVSGIKGSVDMNISYMHY